MGLMGLALTGVGVIPNGLWKAFSAKEEIQLNPANPESRVTQFPLGPVSKN